MTLQLKTAVPVATIVFVVVFTAASAAEAQSVLGDIEGGLVNSILQTTQATLGHVHLALQHLGRF